jgi:hypothetical protein
VTILPNLKDDEVLFRRRTIAALEAINRTLSVHGSIVAVGIVTLDSLATSTVVAVPGARDTHLALVSPNDADAAALAPFVVGVTADELEIGHDSGTGGDVTFVLIAPPEDE